MKDFFKKMGLVEDKKVEEGANKNIAPSNQPAYKPIENIIPVYKQSPNVQVEDPEIRQRIFTIFEEAKKDSGVTIDYLDFKKALDKMKNNPLSDMDKFKAIFDVLSSTTNLSQPVLISSLEKYFTIIANEKKEFETVVAKQLDLKVNSINSQLSIENKSIEVTKAEIQKLQDQISNSEIKIKSLTTELSNVNESANQQSSAFITTLTIVSEELTKDYQIIKTL